MLFVDIVVQIREDIYVCLCGVLRVWGYLRFVAMKISKQQRRNTTRTTRISPHRHKTPVMPTRTHTTYTNTYGFFYSLVSCECIGSVFCTAAHVPYTKQHVYKVEEKKRIDKLNRHSHHNPLQQSLVRAHSLASSPHSEHV